MSLLVKSSDLFPRFTAIAVSNCRLQKRNYCQMHASWHSSTRCFADPATSIAWGIAEAVCWITANDSAKVLLSPAYSCAMRASYSIEHNVLIGDELNQPRQITLRIAFDDGELRQVRAMPS